MLIRGSPAQEIVLPTVKVGLSKTGEMTHQSSGNPAEEETKNNIRAREDGGHQENKVFQVNMSQTPMNPQRLKQLAQGPHRFRKVSIQTDWIPKIQYMQRKTSPSVIVNGFSERLRASHIQRIRPHSENLVIFGNTTMTFTLASKASAQKLERHGLRQLLRRLNQGTKSNTNATPDQYHTKYKKNSPAALDSLFTKLYILIQILLTLLDLDKKKKKKKKKKKRTQNLAGEFGQKTGSLAEEGWHSVDMMQKEDKSLGNLIGTSPFREEDEGGSCEEFIELMKGLEGVPHLPHLTQKEDVLKEMTYDLSLEMYVTFQRAIRETIQRNSVRLAVNRSTITNSKVDLTMEIQRGDVKLHLDHTAACHLFQISLEFAKDDFELLILLLASPKRRGDLRQTENSSKFYVWAHIMKSGFKCHMDAKSPIKNKKYTLTVHHQDGMLRNKDCTCAGNQMDQLQSQQFLPLPTVWHKLPPHLLEFQRGLSMWLSLELKLHMRRAHCGSHPGAERQEEGSRDHDTSFGYYSKTNKKSVQKIESLDPDA
ncbi:hypothetical protein U0070_019785 [Myodes glareolus]|uniref:Uncharacterized protein n=1 Tax=Myodes glareolus TaxID=447135 RepID=A0AAW0JD52_MYOGA